MIKKEFLNDLFILSTKIISDKSIVNKCINLDYGFLYINEDTKYKYHKVNGTSLYLIGYILDVQNSEREDETILQELLEKYLTNEEEFYSFLNLLNGRYVLIISNEYDSKVYTDATSMKPIFYYEDWLLSSHEIILKEIVKVEENIELKNRDFPMKNFLDYTNTENIYRFNPNLFFSFKYLEFHRFFPRNEYNLRDLETVIVNTEKYIQPQIEWLQKNYKKVSLSLTGGFDSKFSLALIKPIINQVETFTYMYKFNEKDNYDDLSQFKKIYFKDKVIVDNLVYNFHLNHKYFYFADYKTPANYLNDIKNNVSSHHSYQLSYLTFKEFNRDSIHLKSTLYELAKLPYGKNKDTPVDGSWAIQLIKHWAPQEIKDDDKILLELYKNYYKRNFTGEILKLNYNLPLMLYWEYRMANWHGNLTQETDFIWDTFVFINSRYMLDQLISLPQEVRKEKTYLTSLINKHWPALNYFVANSFETLEDKINNN